MTAPDPDGPWDRPLADRRSLMSHPVGYRRGVWWVERPANPAAGAGYSRKTDGAWFERIVSLYFTFAAAAGSSPRQVLINLLDGDGLVFNTTPAIQSVQGGETWIVSADLAGTVSAGGGTSEGAAGTATSPAAGATIASVTVGPGLWQLAWNVSLSGTVGAPEQNNFKATVTGVNLDTSDNPAAAGGPWIQSPVEFEAPAGGTTAAIKTIALATTGAVYDASFSVIPQGAAGAFPQLPDIMLRPGWQIQVAVAGIQAGDQVSGIAVLVERYASDWADGTLLSDFEGELARGEG